MTFYLNKYLRGGSFKEAFNAARKAKVKYFEYDGKLFHTQDSKNDKDWDQFYNNLAELETGRMSDTFGWEPEKSNVAFVKSEREAYNLDNNRPGYQALPPDLVAVKSGTVIKNPGNSKYDSTGELYHTTGKGTQVLRTTAGYYGQVPEGGERENPLKGRVIVGPRDFDYSKWWANTGLKLSDITPVSEQEMLAISNNGRQGGGKRVPGKVQKSYNRKELRNKYAKAYMKKLKEANQEAYKKFYNEQTGRWKSDAMFERNFKRWLENNNLRRNGLGFGSLYITK